MNLLCLLDFTQGDISAKAGEILTIAPGAGRWLLDSFPACWDVAPDAAPPAEEVATAAIEAPPADKMMHAAHKAKADIDRRKKIRGALRG